MKSADGSSSPLHFAEYSVCQRDRNSFPLGGKSKTNPTTWISHFDRRWLAHNSKYEFSAILTLLSFQALDSFGQNTERSLWEGCGSLPGEAWTVEIARSVVASKLGGQNYTAPLTLFQPATDQLVEVVMFVRKVKMKITLIWFWIWSWFWSKFCWQWRWWGKIAEPVWLWYSWGTK